MPKAKAMTSASGRMEQVMARGQKRIGMPCGANAIPAAAATAACEMADGTVVFLLR